MPKLTLNSVSPKVTTLEMPNQCKVELISKFMCNYNNKKDLDCILLGNEEKGIDLSAPNTQLFYMFSPNIQTEQPCNNFNFNEIQNIMNFATVDDKYERNIDTIYSKSVPTLIKMVKTPKQINALNELLDMKFSKIEALRALKKFDFDVHAATEFLLNNGGKCVDVHTNKRSQSKDETKNSQQKQKFTVYDLCNPLNFCKFYTKDIRFYNPDQLLRDAIQIRKLYNMQHCKLDLNKVDAVSEYLIDFRAEDRRANYDSNTAIDSIEINTMTVQFKECIIATTKFLETFLCIMDANFTFYQLAFNQILMKMFYAIQIKSSTEFSRVMNQFERIHSAIAEIAYDSY